MTIERLYQTAIGLEVGDIIRTDYGTGPYEIIGLTPPRHVIDCMFYRAIHRLPVVSIALGVPPGHSKYPTCGESVGHINEVRLHEGRYRANSYDEIFVEKPARPLLLQLDMFASYLQPDAPYVEQSGIDYDAGDGLIFCCDRCQRDFNTARRHRPPTCCPICGRVAKPILVFRYADGGHDSNEYLRHLNI